MNGWMDENRWMRLDGWMVDSIRDPQTHFYDKMADKTLDGGRAMQFIKEIY